MKFVREPKEIEAKNAKYPSDHKQISILLFLYNIIYSELSLHNSIIVQMRLYLGLHTKFCLGFAYLILLSQIYTLCNIVKYKLWSFTVLPMIQMLFVLKSLERNRFGH